MRSDEGTTSAAQTDRKENNVFNDINVLNKRDVTVNVGTWSTFLDDLFVYSDE